MADVTSPKGKRGTEHRFPALCINVYDQILGGHCGTKYINDALRSKVLELLGDETYLETNGKALEDIVGRNVMYPFETSIKPSFSLEKQDQWVDLEIPGLRANT